MIDVATAVTAANCVDVMVTDVNNFSANALILGECCEVDGSNCFEANQRGKHLRKVEYCRAGAKSVRKRKYMEIHSLLKFSYKLVVIVAV